MVKDTMTSNEVLMDIGGYAQEQQKIKVKKDTPSAQKTELIENEFAETQYLKGKTKKKQKTQHLGNE